MITFQEDSYTKLFTPEFMSMYKDHWREIGIFDRDKVKLSPNWDMYKAMGKLNSLVLFTAKSGDDVVGYNLFIITYHPHYAATKVAENDIIYLKPEFRKGFTGYKFIKYSVEELKKKVKIITLSMKADHPFAPIVKRLGFELTDLKHTLEI